MSTHNYIISIRKVKIYTYIYIHNMSRVKAACIIIGDEILNGKIIDTNSRFFAKFCFNLGIDLTTIIAIGDDEAQIIETVKYLSTKHQLIVTSGGIGSTHDDITYEAIAKSFDLPCVLNEECKARMYGYSNPEARLRGQALRDYLKMATLPTGPQVVNYWPLEKSWIPVCCIDSQVFIFPGIPQLFERLLTAMTPTLKKLFSLEENGSGGGYVRYYVKTHHTESQISHALGELQKNASMVSQSVKLGSYPHYGMGFNTISILGHRKDDELLREIVKKAIDQFDGVEISAEEEDKYSNKRV